MVVKEFLKLVKIFELSVGRYHRNVDDLYHHVRFGAVSSKSRRTPLELGRALLASRDFCRTAAGLADDHRVMLPVGDIMQHAHTVAARLRFMLHAPRNEGVIDSLLAALEGLQEFDDASFGRRVQEKRRSSKKRSWLAHVDIDDLAERITTLADQHPKIARSLLRGDLNRAADLARELACQDDRHDAACLLREMALVWGLFDLQIIAARLFHSEHGGYAGGTPDAPQAALTTESVTKMIRTLHRAGRAASLRVFKPRGKLTASDEGELEWFDRFIEENELRQLAFRQGKELGFTATEMAQLDAVDPTREADLLRYLAAAGFFARQIKDAFEVAEKRERATFVGAASVSYPSRPAKGTNGKPPLPKMVSERHLEATIQRYGVNTVSALTFAVVSTITTVCRLPTGDKLLKGGFNVAKARGSLLERSHPETNVIRELIWLYRNVIVRDPNHFVHGFEVDDYRRLLDDALEDGATPIEPASATQPVRMDWVMGRGLLANQKIEAFETTTGTVVRRQQSRIPADGLRDTLALIRCIEDDGKRISKAHRPAMQLFDHSFSTSLDMRFAPDGARNRGANPTISRE